ncbi:hypothetical protein PTQ33_03870 [Campylobacter sp. 50012-21]|uniref:hypothetical protein n=1 Tax=Campylobacter magnus TaxID=3026462 RepID=UPI00235E2363|nr:hypothetical protein [Campylobacter magnus]MDD0846258.1 hypothetical protein [Campylobacter magnus]
MAVLTAFAVQLVLAKLSQRFSAATALKNQHEISPAATVDTALALRCEYKKSPHNWSLFFATLKPRY